MEAKPSVKDDLDEIENRLTALMEHLLKYQAIPELQTSKWVGTIIRASGDLKSLYEKRIAYVDRIDNDKAYNKALNDCMKNYRVTGGIPVDKRFRKYSNRPQDFTIENLINMNWIYKYLKDYANWDRIQTIEALQTFGVI